MHLEYWLQAFMETPGTLTFTTKNIYIILWNNYLLESAVVEKIVLFCDHSYPHHQRFCGLDPLSLPRVQIKSVLQLAIRASCS